MSLRERLRRRAQSQGPIRVGLVGAGQMGAGFISQTEKMEGMRVVATADVVPGRAAEAYRESGVPADQIVSLDEHPERAAELIQQGRRIATTDANFLVQIGALDVVLECTGVPEVGAQVCYAAIQAGKHIVNMNVEADATVGYALAHLAAQRGVVYSLVAGDEPGSIKELYDFADALGFEVVYVGKGKNNPLDRSATPAQLEEAARRQQMNPKMLASFVDGTKTMVEMTSIGNGVGFAPEVTGGRGPRCSVQELPLVFVPKEAGGVFEGVRAVDFAIGDVAPGVFVTITTDQPKVIRDLRYLRLLGNPRHDYWVLYRPYHLANLEAPLTVARVVLDGEETLATHRPPVAETVAYAKRDLHPGERIDALGGFTVYGMIERAERARANQEVPLGLVVGGVVTRPIVAHQPIHYDEIELNTKQRIVQLRQEQDRLLGYTAG
ncbi:MAG: SAF domain-containing protein [Anaerolineae bacterium]|nr:SAF domain-containing protein [Anaerolineae bacterium]